jgi:adenine-specific DNA-methyltransferase
MAAIKDLLRQITDPALRERLKNEFDRISKNKKFGLVFEEHVPECTPLYGIPIRRGSSVARKTGKMKQIFTVKKITGKSAVCVDEAALATETIPLAELVSVAHFGEPIFPSLASIAKVRNAPDDSLWHTLIEADNYHALQLLEYLYEGKVDCIYIDPPYNTGARDWKYNNDYVDSSDAWRHSKWLSMMKKRLRLAKRLLNPADSVLIVTIDEKEYLHLGCLLEEMFPEARMQMVTIVTNPFGQERARQLARVEEYAYFLFIGSATPCSLTDDFLNIRESTLAEENLREAVPRVATPTEKIRWEWLLRGGADALRRNNPGLFFPVFIDAKNRVIHSVGEPLPFFEMDRNSVIAPNGTIAVWPIKTNGTEGRWRCSPSYLRELIAQGYARIGEYDKSNDRWTLLYLNKSQIRRIASGEVKVLGMGEDGSVLLDSVAKKQQKFSVKTVWFRPLHRAGEWGTRYIRELLTEREFPYPKSLYAVADTLRVVTDNKPEALVVDFFAGSGTTFHAVNLLNAEDGGKRRCILVTNNEVSEAETKDLKTAGYQPGDEEWESHGICRSVTWPRTEYSILGKRADGTVLSGEYFTSQTTTKEVNRSFYQLGFVETPTVLAPAAKKQIVALLGKGVLPQSLVKSDSRFIVSEKHTASVLFDTEAADDWLAALEEQEHITDFYIMAKDSRTFNDIKAKVVDLLGTVSVTEPLKRPMSEGFAANVEYFKLGFLDKNSVSLGRQFCEILPLLWLKAGAVGERPELDGEDLPEMLILPRNSFAVLLDEDRYGEFAEKLAETDGIETVYFVTNSEEAFREMSDGIGTERTYQLYRDYIDNFVIGSRRNKQ